MIRYFLYYFPIFPFLIKCNRFPISREEIRPFNSIISQNETEYEGMGIKVLHDNKINHRNLKPSNVLLFTGTEDADRSPLKFIPKICMLLISFHFVFRLLYFSEVLFTIKVLNFEIVQNNSAW